MFLFKRDGIYYLEYFDELENRKRRVSTKNRCKSEALKFLTKFKEQLKNRSKVEFVTIEKFREEYCKYIEQTHSDSYLSLIKTSFKFLVEFAGNVPLIKLNNRILEKFITEQFNRTKYGARHHYINLKAALNKAVSWGYLIENPLMKIKLPKIPSSSPIFIEEHELNLIVMNTSNKDLQDIFITGIHTGARLAEILNLQWSAINLKEKKIIIQNNETFTTKSKRERIIPINDTLYEVLKTRFPKVLQINNNEYVFQKCSGVPYLKDYVSKSFKKIVRKLNLSESYHFHLLRVNFGSHLLRKGIPISSISKLLGHSSIAVTEKHYTSLSIENLTQAVKVLDKAV